MSHQRLRGRLCWDCSLMWHNHPGTQKWYMSVSIAEASSFCSTITILFIHCNYIILHQQQWRSGMDSVLQSTAKCTQCAAGFVFCMKLPPCITLKWCFPDCYKHHMQTICTPYNTDYMQPVNILCVEHLKDFKLPKTYADSMQNIWKLYKQCKQHTEDQRGTFFAARPVSTPNCMQQFAQSFPANQVLNCVSLSPS